jgi:sugar phosphate isomerase/epimerase
LKAGLGITLDSFGQPVKQALATAHEMGFGAIELPAASGEVAPSSLGQSGRRHLKRVVSNLGLTFSSLGGDPGGRRFADQQQAERHIETTRGILEMAAEMQVPVVTTHLGRFTEDPRDLSLLREVLHEVGQQADRTGRFVAVETASLKPEELARILKDVNCSWLGACCDPANMLIEGADPIQAVEAHADHIWLARARDAVAGSPQQPGYETNIGSGEMDWTRYLASLEQAGYGRSPFVRRLGSNRSVRDVADARQQLQRFMR